MNVVYCVTSDYIDKIKPSIKSLREHNPGVKIYLVTETDTADIPDVEVINIRSQQYFLPDKCINYNNQFTYIGLLKVCYQSLLPVDKVIHIDADTVITDSLEPMWNIDLEGKWYAMCKEIQTWYKPFGDLYYNAGIMLINLKQLREDDIQSKMVEYLNSVKQPWCEQDAFNKYGIEHNKIVDLDIRFNEAKTVGYTDNPAIVHYCTVKNWFDEKDFFRWEYLEKYKESENE